MSLRAARVLVAAATALALAATAAYATRVVKIASHVSIKSQSLTFTGKVTSPNPGCVAGRHVTLYRKPHNKLGTATTGPKGRWKITVSGFAGVSLAHFYAHVWRRSEGTAGTIYVCKGATSPTIPFHQ
jgi:hypothetical protein